MSFSPEKLNQGGGVRRFARPATPEVPEHLLSRKVDPIMKGRPPTAAACGLLDLAGLPMPTPAPIYEPGGRRPMTSFPAGKFIGNSWLAPTAAETPPRRPQPERQPLPKAPPLPYSSSARWIQVNEQLGDSREQIFLGNNLREIRTQSFLNSTRPQLDAPASSMSKTATGAYPGTKGTTFDANYFYRTTSSSTYGSFAKLPALQNTVGHLRQPLFLAVGVGSRGSLSE